VRSARESAFEPIKTVPNPVRLRGSSLYQATRPMGGDPPPPTIMAIASKLPRLLTATAAPAMAWLPPSTSLSSINNDRGDSPTARAHIARARLGLVLQSCPQVPLGCMRSYLRSYQQMF
jgi:hypothetical protein